jgi:tetratricopeptide (TPR) repeat protein
MEETLLQRLRRERRLTRQETIRVLERRAQLLGVADQFTLSMRQLDRWLAGQVEDQPAPVRVRVLEAEFGHSIGELLAPAGEPRAQVVAIAAPLVPVDIHRLVTDSARESSQFAQWADSLGVGDLALTTLWLRVQELASGYVHAAMVPVFRSLEALRDELFDLLREPEPGQARDLYLLTGLVCGMLAHASGNLGEFKAAHVQMCTALVCARKAGHPTLSAWVLGVRALQCEWNGHPAESLTYTARAHAYLADEYEASSVGVWIDAIEARACARLGRPEDATRALNRAIDLRDRLPGSDDLNDLDEIGGILTFPQAKQLYYAGTAYRRIGEMEEAETSSTAAIEAYVSGPVELRSYGDEAIARIDLVIAHAGEPDLEAAAEVFRVIGTMPSQFCLPTMASPLRDLRAILTVGAIRRDHAAAELREAVERVLHCCEARSEALSR